MLFTKWENLEEVGNLKDPNWDHPDALKPEAAFPNLPVVARSKLSCVIDGGRGSHFWPFRGSNRSQNIVVHTEKARWNGSGECQAENNRESKWRGRRGGRLGDTARSREGPTKGHKCLGQ